MGDIGIIGGSALYDLEGLDVIEEKKIDTPFGPPSDDLVVGKIGGKRVVFLPRHGKGHRMLPTEINNRANIYALKVMGVDKVISVSAVGSLKEDIAPLDIVLVDQFIDRTNQARPATFFGEGIVAHIPFNEPVCSELREAIYKSNKSLDVKIHDGGTYLNMEGPAFSTKAESYLYKSWGIDVIGMTNMSEARLAREAGMCYSTIALVTDYDSWYLGEGIEPVSVDIIIENVNKNIEMAKMMIINAVAAIEGSSSCSCEETLKDAIFTSRDMVPDDVKEKLKPIIGKFL